MISYFIVVDRIFVRYGAILESLTVGVFLVYLKS